MVDSTATTEAPGAHKLLRSIAAMREDLGRLIDEHLAANEERVPEAPASPFPLAVTPEMPHVRVNAPEPIPTPAAVTTPPLAAFESEPAEARRRLSPIRPKEARGAALVTTTVTARLDDPRQRLDALAKLLDRRLKHPAAGPDDSSTELDGA